MRFFSIDTFLADLNVAVDHVGGKVDLIGICQGGWMGLLYAARFQDIAHVVRSEGKPALSASFPPKARLFLVAVCILSIGSLPLGVLLFKTQDLGIASASIPLFYAICNVTYAAFSWPAGRIADQIGTSLVMVVGYGLLIVAFIVLSLSSEVWILVIGFPLLGGFSAFTDGVQRSYLPSLIAEEHEGSAYGYLNGVAGIGALIAGVVGGFLWQRVGDTAALLVAAGVIVLGLVVFGIARTASNPKSD
jgi:MFS family permease